MNSYFYLKKHSQQTSKIRRQNRESRSMTLSRRSHKKRSPSAPLDTCKSRVDGSTCCQYRDQIVDNLEREIDELMQLLKLEQENKSTLDKYWKQTLDENNLHHNKKLIEMGTILASQKKVLTLYYDIFIRWSLILSWETNGELKWPK